MNKFLSVKIAMATAATLLVLSATSIASDGIIISEHSAWARATPPGSKTTAIYLTLTNNSGADVILTDVTADISDRVELHTHINNDGMMKMQQVSSITVPANGQASLKPHGDHIMVFNLQEQLKAGAEISVELTFNDGNTKTLPIPVHKEAPMPDDSTDHNEKHQSMENKEADDAHQHDKAS